MTPAAAVRPDPQPSPSFAQRAQLDQAGVARAAEVLGILLADGELETKDLYDMAARVVAAYAVGSTQGAIVAARRQSPRERAAIAEAQRRTIDRTRSGERCS